MTAKELCEQFAAILKLRQELQPAPVSTARLQGAEKGNHLSRSIDPWGSKKGGGHAD